MSGSVWIFIIILTFFQMGASRTALSAETDQEKQPAEATAQVIRIDGALGPAAAGFVSDALKTAVERKARLVILVMDTPGGLAESMRAIIREILGSPIPVAGFVSPSGARAASAGTYILYACHVAAMSPGTNLGAATPIQVGGIQPGRGGEEEKEKGEGDMRSKLVNDAVAYIRSLAQLRNRNADWAEESVRKGASLPVEEALQQKVIDFIAADLQELLEKADGMKVTVQNREVVLNTRGLTTQSIEPSWSNRFLSIITNPNVAIILLLIGIYGLIFEFTSPGSIGPGIVGLICLLLGLYALHILPLNYTGLALIIFGVALMVAEAFVPSFGVLGIGGIASFLIGAAILIDTDYPGFRISWGVIVGTAAASGAVLIFLLGFVWKAHRRPAVTGMEGLAGSRAEVVEWSGNKGHVRVHGELWRAEGRDKFSPGDEVGVIAARGLTLVIGPLEEQKRA